MQQLTPDSIEQVRNIDIYDVVSKYVDLKKKGNSWVGLSPFTTEKTPSFSVHPQKGIFKCFSTGKAGDAIGFVMQSQNVGFIEAIKEIASSCNVTLSYTQVDDKEAAEQDRIYQERKSIQIILNYAAAWFQSNEIPKEFVKHRRLKEDAIKDFQIGFAPDTKNEFALAAVAAGYDADLLVKANLVRKIENGTLYDVFRNRVMFPVCDKLGNVLSFTGRIATDPKPDDENKPQKYFNSSDAIWTKGDHLYGLHKAFSHINTKGFAFLVEGNMDVVQMYQASLKNVVCACGTSLTVNQIKLLKKYTDTVVIVPDNDEPKKGEDGNYIESSSPGIKALHKNALLLIEQGFIVKVLLPDFKLDPDDQLKKLHTPEKVNEWANKKEDYISDFLARDCTEEGKVSPDVKAKQIKRMADVIEKIPDNTLRQLYYDSVGDYWPDFKKKYKLEKKESVASKVAIEKLKKDSKRDYFDFGFYEKDGAYYTYHNKQEFRICTFVINILYFIYTDGEAKYVCKFTNMYGKSRITYVNTDDFTSVSSIKKIAGRLGPFVWLGNEEHLGLIKVKLFYGVKEASEPAYMGYNKRGNFYTWANGIYYNKAFIPADKYGMVQLNKPISSYDQFLKLVPESQVQIGEVVEVLNDPNDLVEKLTEETIKQVIADGELFLLNYYYLPFASVIKSNDEAEETDDMKKKFKHFLKPGLSFERWSTLMINAYGENGKVAICFYIACAFRDIIYESNNNYFPILYFFGLRGSGKSKAAESLACMFGEVIEDGINLESGSTTTGIRRFMSSVQNGLIWLNEYKNTLAMQVIGMLKGIADGSGKLTGQKTNGLETKSFKPRSAAVMCGQDLPTKDPALLSRCICAEFSKENRQYHAYEELKNLERSGMMTGITCHIQHYREFIIKYPKVEPTITKELKALCKETISFEIDDRVILNMASILTPVKILMDEAKVEFPFTYDEIFDILIKKISKQADIQATSDDVEQYLFVVISLIGTRLFEGEHFMIVRELDNKVKLLLRMNVIHSFYLEAATRQGITPLSIMTLKSYVEKHRSYLEYRPKNVKFTNLENRTSATVLNYEMLIDQGIEFKTTNNIQSLPKQDVGGPVEVTMPTKQLSLAIKESPEPNEDDNILSKIYHDPDF